MEDWDGLGVFFSFCSEFVDCLGGVESGGCGGEDEVEEDEVVVVGAEEVEEVEVDWEERGFRRVSGA